VVCSGFREEPTNCLRFHVFLINSVATFHIYVLRYSGAMPLKNQCATVESYTSTVAGVKNEPILQSDINIVRLQSFY